MSHWTQVEGAELHQGDLIEGCPVLILPADVSKEGLRTVDVASVRVIVLSQTCDLVQSPTPIHIITCRVYTISEWCTANPKFRQPDQWNEVRARRRPGLHILGALRDTSDCAGAMLVNFAETFVVSFASVQGRVAGSSERFRLTSPYREDLSQAFASFFMRVAVPQPVPKFDRNHVRPVVEASS